MVAESPMGYYIKLAIKALWVAFAFSALGVLDELVRYLAR
jgi:hypothetical protein